MAESSVLGPSEHMPLMSDRRHSLHSPLRHEGKNAGQAGWEIDCTRSSQLLNLCHKVARAQFEASNDLKLKNAVHGSGDAFFVSTVPDHRFRQGDVKSAIVCQPAIRPQ